MGMAVDLLHPGHLNVISKAAELGEVIIGLLTDKAVACGYAQLPYMSYEHREIVVAAVKGVTEVVRQETLDYRPNLEKIQPKYVVHGDDWKTGPLASTRQQVIDTLARWGGQLVEVPYTQGISSTMINNVLRSIGITPEIRSQRLKRLIEAKDIVRVIEAHSGLSALIAENTSVEIQGREESFDAIWVSSLTQSAAKAKPDNGFLDTTSRLETVNDILDVSTKPIIYDGDNGGPAEHFVFTVKALERLGVSAVIIEDKIGLKKILFSGTASNSSRIVSKFFAKRSGLVARPGWVKLLWSLPALKV